MSRKGTNQKENSNFITCRGALRSTYRIFFMSGRRNLDPNKNVDLQNVRKYRREASINIYNSPSKRKCQQSGAWILNGVQKEKKDIAIRTLIGSKSHLYSSRSCYHHVWLEVSKGEKKKTYKQENQMEPISCVILKLLLWLRRMLTGGICMCNGADSAT